MNVNARLAWRLIAILLCVASIVSAATQARAHATLVSSDPHDGAMLASAPSSFTLTFNEPVAPLVVRLIGPDGQAATPKIDAADRTITLTTPAQLVEGTHVLSWRVISADGHPIGGALLFSVGRKSEPPLSSVRLETEWPVRASIWLARVAIYLGLFIGIGGAFFTAWIASPLPRAVKPAANRFLAASLGLALIAAPLSIGLQGLDALAAPLRSLWQPAIWTAGFHTSYGMTAAVAVVAFLLGLGALLWRHPLGARVLSLVAVASGGLALASSGHASAATPQWLMRPSVFVHAAAIALWAGSLVPLFALLRSTRGGQHALLRFSRAVPFALAPLTLSGIVLAVVQLDHVSALWTTNYGLVLLLKAVALAGLVVLATFNRYGLTPAVVRGVATARFSLMASVGGEIALVLAIFGLVALWRFTPPPRALVSGEPAFVHIHDEKAMADVTVAPGRSGPVVIRLHLMREDFTALPAKEVTLLLSNKAAGIEPITRIASDRGNGDWRVDDLTLPLAGVWTMRIEVLVGDFDRSSSTARL